MSGIALVLKASGRDVTGSDLKRSGYTRLLEDAGVPVSIGHRAENLGDPEVVVVSSAIPETNPELAEARERGIPVWPRARMLAELAGSRLTVAIAGTHGKTTTSSMATAALAGAGADPTFLIGGELNDVGANAGCGSGPHYVVEADESDGSFLYLEPHVALVTNVEADHLDHYGTLEAIEETFVRFMSKVPDNGALVVCADDARLVELARTCERGMVTYGCAEDADVRCVDATPEGLSYRFAVELEGRRIEAGVALPGMHNVVNATGALAAVHALGLDPADAVGALRVFAGVRRRFDLVGEVDGVTIVDDYAHHPTELKATLAAARQGGFRRVWAVFQPHRYSRTAALGEEFAEAFELADRVVMMDVYSAGETPIPGVSGKTLIESVLVSQPRTRMTYFPHRTDLEPYLTERVKPGDLVMTLGAGDVTTVGAEIVRGLERRRTSLEAAQ
jgi:UDP-N-acetylmuramate--alanine ligase